MKISRKFLFLAISIAVVLIIMTISLLNEKSKLLWVSNLDSRSDNVPAISKDIIFVSTKNTVYALTKKGKTLWAVKIPEEITTPPVVYKNGVVIGTSKDYNGWLYYLENGKQIWKVEMPNKVTKSPAVVNDNIYVSSDRFIIKLKDSKMSWRFEMGAWGSSAPIIDSFGNVYVASNDGNLYALTEDGELLWRSSTFSPLKDLSMDNDGTIYGYNEFGTVLSFSSSGKLNWRYDTSSVINEGIVLDEKAVYVANTLGELLVFSKSGELKKREKFNLPITTGLNITSDGKIYFFLADGRLFYYSEKKNKDVYKLPSTTSVTPRIDKDVLYVLSGNTITAVKVPSKGLLNSPWSTFRANNENTGYSQYLGIMPISPKQEDILTKPQVALEWKLSTNQNTKNTKFDVYFGDQLDNLKKIKSNLATTTFIVENLSYDKSYFWKIVANYGLGKRIQSRVFKFSVKHYRNKWEKKFTIRPRRAVISDNKIYVLFENSNLVCLNSENGEVLWKYEPGSFINVGPVVGNDGSIYLGGNGILSISDGVLKWKSLENRMYVGDIGIDSEGRILACSISNTNFEEVSFHCFEQDGREVWNLRIPNPIKYGIATTKYGRTFAPGNSNEIFVIDKNGMFVGTSQAYGWINPVAIGPDGKIYYTSSDRYLYAMRPDRFIEWTYKALTIPANGPVVDDKNNIYFSDIEGNIYCIDGNTGKERWVKKINDKQVGDLIISKDGWVFAYDMDGTVYCISQEGKTNWSFSISPKKISQLLLNEDGIIFLLNDQGEIIALETISKGLAETGWPILKGNLKGNSLEH